MFAQRLEQVDGLRVKSIGGSAKDGPNIIISVDQPLPLVARLNDLDEVARVSKGAKSIMVGLRERGDSSVDLSGA
jgi:hypothetical protein